MSVTGSLKPSEWVDKTTGELKHGLNVTVSNVLSAYDIKKKRRTETPEQTTKAYEFNDALPFYLPGRAHNTAKSPLDNLDTLDTSGYR